MGASTLACPPLHPHQGLLALAGPCYCGERVLKVWGRSGEHLLPVTSLLYSLLCVTAKLASLGIPVFSVPPALTLADRVLSPQPPLLYLLPRLMARLALSALALQPSWPQSVPLCSGSWTMRVHMVPRVGSIREVLRGQAALTLQAS